MSANGYSPIFPLVKEIDGPYSMHANIVDSVRQNLKLILLTSPGERIMLPSFGVGLRSYLFEQDRPNLQSEISNKIKQQFKRFMPFLDLKSFVKIKSDENLITVEIKYRVKPLSIDDSLTLDILSNKSIKDMLGAFGRIKG